MTFLVKPYIISSRSLNPLDLYSFATAAVTSPASKTFVIVIGFIAGVMSLPAPKGLNLIPLAAIKEEILENA